MALVGSALVVLCAAQPAWATSIFSSSLRAPVAKKRTCESRLAPGARGVVVRRVTAADTGLLRARLGARRGDWDLAVFDAATNHLITASTGFRSREVAEGFVLDGQRLAVQACRRKGRARIASVGVRTIGLAPTTETISLVRVRITSQAEGTRLASAGFDLTEHGRPGYLDVLAHGADDLRALREQKFSYDVVIKDVVAADAAAFKRHSKRQAPGDGTPLEGARAPVMPSGRVTYRHLWDYTSDMKALLENPALAGWVRPITLAHPSLEGRSVEGIEIAKDAGADDGRPVFLQMGVHHAREWPSGEHAIEFGFDLLNNRNATAVQFADRTVNVKELLEKTRTIVVPIVNPDGFNLSREAANDGQGVVNFAGSHAYKRKNCRIQDGLIPAPGECAAAGTTRGVDPNRNYGQFWGGPGASGSPTNDTYWGAGPFSEPEIQNVRELVSQRHVVSLITNHTFSELVLRPPGLKSQGEPFDEDGHYKPLGDAMAEQNGYASQYGYELYDTTGTTEDWSYAATGGLGFTFEIGGGWSVVTSAGFHPAYPVGVPTEYFGKGPHAGKGNRSAYYLALEFVADTANHSLIEGTAKPGTELRLTKTFETLTSPRPENGGQPIALTDTLSDTLSTGGGGSFSWHVNPSTRPMVAKGVAGRVVDGRPQTATRDFETSSPPVVPNEGLADVPGSSEVIEFSIPETEDNGRSVVRMEYPPGTGASDLDLYVDRKLDDGTWEQMGSGASANTGANPPCTLAGRTGNCDFEEAVIPDLGNGQFRLRVVNYESTSTDWVARLTTSAPVADPGVPPATESYTLTCIDTRKNRVLAQRAVTVARGEQVNVGDACKKPKAG